MLNKLLPMTSNNAAHIDQSLWNVISQATRVAMDINMIPSGKSKGKGN